MNSLFHTFDDGRRLEIRPLTQVDVERLVSIRRDERLIPFQYSPESTFKETLELVANLIEEQPDVDFPWYALVFDGHTVGDVAATGDRKKMTFSWNLDPEFWGNGIMTKALEMVIQHRFSIAPRLVIRADSFPDNVGSIRVMEKLGFEQIVLSKFRTWLWDVFSFHSRKVLRFRLTESGFQNRKLGRENPSS
ncbi:MAG: GNAT family N-acetyltransferase [Mariniblastus sp.]